jgi:hypothetical protein
MATVKKTEATATVNGAAMEANTGAVIAGEEGVRRRDFIHIAAISFAGVGAGAVILPVLTTMGASADVLALASIEVDISKVEVGQAIKLSWRKQPVNFRRADKARQRKLVDHDGCLHPFGLCSAGRSRRRSARRVWRLFLPMPRIAL